MLAFITSLRHPHNSADYGRVQRLLQLSLNSFTAQTTDEFVVIIVGNEQPDFDLPERAHFVGVDFPSPSVHNGPAIPLPSFVWDKGTKIGIGLAAAREFDPDYVMICDADDFVHRDLARFVSESSNVTDGWVIQHGYMFSSTRNAYRSQRDFNRACGTCHIVSYDAYGVPDSLTVRASQAEVERAFGERLPRVLGAHQKGLEWFAQHDVNLQPLPFPGAVYHVDTGENHSGNQMRGIARPLRPAMRGVFGIPQRQSLMLDLWSAFGLRAIAETLSQVVWKVRSSLRVRVQRGRLSESSDVSRDDDDRRGGPL